jgi:hypothetical protein
MKVVIFFAGALYAIQAQAAPIEQIGCLESVFIPDELAQFNILDKNANIPNALNAKVLQRIEFCKVKYGWNEAAIEGSKLYLVVGAIANSYAQKMPNDDRAIVEEYVNTNRSKLFGKDEIDVTKLMYDLLAAGAKSKGTGFYALMYIRYLKARSSIESDFVKGQKPDIKLW